MKKPRNKSITKTKPTELTPLAEMLDPHVLYEASVQSAECELAFLKKLYKKKRGKPYRSFREDFSGTGMLSCEWVAKHPKNEAWCVDLDRPTLDWAAKYRVAPLGKAAKRVHLVCEDVMTTNVPKVDMIAALNFSYFIFKDRKVLLNYFKTCKEGLKKKGAFVVDMFGGSATREIKTDTRIIPSGVAPDGQRFPRFKYIWEQASFNPVTHDMVCKIHFKLADGSEQNDAFIYPWRLYSMPEILEVMEEAGFLDIGAYIHDFDEEGDPDDVFKRRTEYEEAIGWIGYIVGWKS